MKSKEDFLFSWIFAPSEVWLPEEYESVLLELNIWPATMLEPQKRALLSMSEFSIGKTTVYTKQPQLKFKMRDGSEES